MKPIAPAALLQPDLFQASSLKSNPHVEVSGYKVTYDQIPVRQSTFLAGLSESVHSWFRLTPSFGPELVRTMISECELQEGAHIHDPFSGTGTTAIEASLEGYRASCVEVNPFLHFVGQTCLEWGLSAECGSDVLAQVGETYKNNKNRFTLDNIETLGVAIPKIHNISRWWRSDVLKDLLVLKAAIRSNSPRDFVSFFELSLAAVLVPDLTNVTLGRLQLHFSNKEHHDFDVWSTFESHTKKMLNDLSALNLQNNKLQGQIFLGDSTKITTFESISGIDAIITSPPYPNRYSYVWNTRPHLYMLDMIKDGKEAAQIDKRTIGGTWGTATSELGKGFFKPINEIVSHALDGIEKKIANSDQLMANYVMHYFNRLALHIQAIGPSLNLNAKLAYVVGNSWIKGEYVATDVILAKIIEGTLPSSRIDRLHRFRRRNSRKDLFETIVYATN